MKLTNAIRQAIITAAIARSSIPKRRAEFIKRHKAFGRTIYDTMIRSQIPQELAASWRESRQEITPWVYTGVSFNFDGLEGAAHYRHYNETEGLASSYPDVIDTSFALDDPVLVPNGSSNINISKNPVLVAEGKKLVDYHKKTNALERDLRAKLNSVLHSVTTTNKLFDLWPEAKDLVPTNTTPYGMLVPTEAIASINQIINSESDE